MTSLRFGRVAGFTDSNDGACPPPRGNLTLKTTDANLSFAELVPGEGKTRNIEYNVDASGASDVWLVFDKNTVGYANWTVASTTRWLSVVVSGATATSQCRTTVAVRYLPRHQLAH